MEWINTFRLQISAELETARARQTVTSAEYNRALAADADAERELNGLERLLAALNQLDPTTAIPEPPL